MNIYDYFWALRKRWLLVVVCILLGTASGAAVARATTPTYEASTRLFVAARETGGVASDLQSSAQFGDDRAESYADIIGSESVTGPVASEVHDGLSPLQISKEVTADSPLNTALVNVHVTDTSPLRAQTLANAVSEEFATYAAQLETTPGAPTSPVKVTVVDQAPLPTSPVSPRTKLDLLIGLIVGLGLGVGAAALRDNLDRTVKNPAAIQEAVDLPFLGAISRDPSARKRPLVTRSNPRSPRAEEFRQLRTSLQYLDIDNAPRSIVVTSAVPKEGKTATVTNLAISLVQSGTRVLLIEGDLRQSRMSEYLGIDGSVGLTSVLLGQVDLPSAIQEWGTNGALKVLPSGPVPPNPSELLGSRRMIELLRELELSYDLVLIDAPPLLPVTDAVVLSKIASGALMIVRHESTKIDELGRAVEALHTVDALVYGFVMTMNPNKGPGAYSQYGQRYRDAEVSSATERVTNEPTSRRHRRQAKSTAAPAGMLISTPTTSAPPETTPVLFRASQLVDRPNGVSGTNIETPQTAETP